MKKDAIIIVIIIIIIAISSICTRRYLEITTSELTGILEELKQQIIECKTDNSMNTKVISKTDSLYENWQGKVKVWSIIVLHSELDLIETSLINMKSKIENGDLENSLNELDNSVFLIGHIKEKEKLSIKNIL